MSGNFTSLWVRPTRTKSLFHWRKWESSQGLWYHWSLTVLQIKYVWIEPTEGCSSTALWLFPHLWLLFFVVTFFLHTLAWIIFKGLFLCFSWRNQVFHITLPQAPNRGLNGPSVRKHDRKSFCSIRVINWDLSVLEQLPQAHSTQGVEQAKLSAGANGQNFCRPNLYVFCSHLTPGQEYIKSDLQGSPDSSLHWMATMGSQFNSGMFSASNPQLPSAGDNLDLVLSKKC